MSTNTRKKNAVCAETGRESFMRASWGLIWAKEDELNVALAEKGDRGSEWRDNTTQW